MTQSPAIAALTAALHNDGHETRQALQHLNPGQLRQIEDAAVLLSLTASQTRRGEEPRPVEPPARVHTKRPEAVSAELLAAAETVPVGAAILRRERAAIVAAVLPLNPAQAAARLRQDARALVRRSKGRKPDMRHRLTLQAYTLHAVADRFAEPDAAAQAEMDELAAEIARGDQP